MRFALRLLAACLACAAFLSGAARAALPIEHWTTSNGARVYFVRADSIPMLDVSLDFDAGGRLDPPGRAGLASLANSMLARGAGGLEESAISEGFARIGAERGGGAGDDRASVTLRTLTSEPELDEALALLARVVAQPDFPAAVLAREKERAIQAIRESETKPETIAQHAFYRAMYGAHPYGAYPTPESVAAITRDDLVAFHRGYYGARNAVVSMIGAISRERAQAIAERLTRDLPPGGAPREVGTVVAPQRAIEQRIEHPASQSHILIGQPSIARGDPDFFALLVGNYVLGGGGFVSRLYDEVREKRGLAYSVYSYFAPMLQPGPFTIGLQTQRDQTAVALGVVRDTLGRFLRDGPTEAELAAAKSNLVGGFALRIDSNRKILDNLAAIGFYRLPLDYLDRWTARVEAVTLGEVRAAFARHVRADALVTVVVGNGDAPGKPGGAAPGASAGTAPGAQGATAPQGAGGGVAR
ncbi:MAG: insulinase family protein [Burkholderiaceae bacterium]|nr:insulinase family protein [Burkholderiaceae bacterium]